MVKEFETRLSRHYDELKWLYCELYSEKYDFFDDFLEILKYYYKNRKEDLKERDRKREKDKRTF